ncbi:MAG: 4Fe-4S binding protein [Candidatus Omnitrophota bacterium]
MTKRKIVNIDEDKCTGCGECIPNCAEGALQIIDGKARLVKDIYCDGLGACLGHCPEGAITIEERDARVFDEEATKRHLEELSKKKKEKLPCGCPGTMVREFKKEASKKEENTAKSDSELSNWPIQMMLVPVEAPYLKGADLLIAADCCSFSYPDFHKDFLKGRVLLIGCPKLDAATLYEEKLAEIFKVNNIRSVTVLHMEVPCCFGMVQIVKEALRVSGKDIFYKEVTVGIKGDLK